MNNVPSLSSRCSLISDFDSLGNTPGTWRGSIIFPKTGKGEVAPGIFWGGEACRGRGFARLGLVPAGARQQVTAPGAAGCPRLEGRWVAGPGSGSLPLDGSCPAVPRLAKPRMFRPGLKLPDARPKVRSPRASVPRLPQRLGRPPGQPVGAAGHPGCPRTALGRPPRPSAGAGSPHLPLEGLLLLPHARQIVQGVEEIFIGLQKLGVLIPYLHDSAHLVGRATRKLSHRSELDVLRF